jgi:hypothetical protein
MQLMIDETASADQKRGLEAILTGKDTEEMATGWYIFNAMCPTKHQTIYCKIESKIDIEERTGSATIHGMFNLEVEPLKNPVSDMPHRAAMSLPNGFDFLYAEVANGTTKSLGGAVELPNNVGTHSQLSRNRMNNQGMIKH